MTKEIPADSDEAAVRGAIVLGREYMIKRRKTRARVFDLLSQLKRRDGDYDAAKQLTSTADKAARQAYILSQDPESN